MNHVPKPQEEKLGYYLQSGTCLGVFETNVLLCFLCSFFCKWPVINVTLLTLKMAFHKIQDYYDILKVSMQFLELYTFEQVININCRHV